MSSEDGFECIDDSEDFDVEVREAFIKKVSHNTLDNCLSTRRTIVTAWAIQNDMTTLSRMPNKVSS